jgi:putative membrane protein
MNKDTLRIILANERTMLAYVRTALSAAIFGMAILKFFHESALLVVIGWVSVAGGIFVFGWGMVEYVSRNRAIRKMDGNENK